MNLIIRNQLFEINGLQDVNELSPSHSVRPRIRRPAELLILSLLNSLKIGWHFAQKDYFKKFVQRNGDDTVWLEASPFTRKHNAYCCCCSTPWSQRLKKKEKKVWSSFPLLQMLNTKDSTEEDNELQQMIYDVLITIRKLTIFMSSYTKLTFVFRWKKDQYLTHSSENKEVVKS